MSAWGWSDRSSVLPDEKEYDKYDQHVELQSLQSGTVLSASLALANGMCLSIYTQSNTQLHSLKDHSSYPAHSPHPSHSQTHKHITHITHITHTSLLITHSSPTHHSHITHTTHTAHTPPIIFSHHWRGNAWSTLCHHVMWPCCWHWCCRCICHSIQLYTSPFTH